jgi:hypothetical protein
LSRANLLGDFYFVLSIRNYFCLEKIVIHENLIRAALMELGCSAEDFAIIANIRPARLSRAFNGREDFTGPEILMIQELIAKLRQLARDAEPLQISFRRPEKIKRLLQAEIRWVCSPVGDAHAIADWEALQQQQQQQKVGQ